MKKPSGITSGWIYLLIFMGIMAIIGAFLRFYQLGGQIIGDDEWHAINIASRSSYTYILTHFHMEDNCIPLTLMDKLLIDSIGLNELSLHLVQAVVGVLIIIVFPILAERIIGKHISAVFALLLAVLPLLVYYSRFARPYIFVVFLSFPALISFYYWLETKNKWYLTTYILGSILCSYFSPVSIPSLVAPLLFSFYLAVFGRNTGEGNPSKLSVSYKEILLVSVILCAGILIWLLPAVSSLGAITSKAGEGSIQMSTLTNVLKMFSGFGNSWIALCVMISFCMGLIYQYKINRHFLFFMVTIILVQFLAISLINPYRIELSHVFSRYNISCLPLYLMVVSIGVWSGIHTASAKLLRPTQSKKIATLLSVILFVSLYLSSSPIRTTYASINNFSNHDDFQYGYNSIVYKNNMQEELVSGFYRNLGKESVSTSIIEFPYVIWWSGNYFHLYQQLHRKKVLIGFWEPYYLIPQFITAEHVTLRNFINIGAPDSLISSGAKYLVIHRDMAWERKNIKSIYETGNEIDKKTIDKSPNIFEDRYGPLSRKMANDVIIHLRGVLGEPYFEDEWITVFKIPNEMERK